MLKFIKLIQNLMDSLTDVEFNDIVKELQHKDDTTYFMIPWQFSHLLDFEQVKDSLPSSHYARYGDGVFDHAEEAKEQGFEYKPTIFINESKSNALETLKKMK